MRLCAAALSPRAKGPRSKSCTKKRRLIPKVVELFHQVRPQVQRDTTKTSSVYRGVSLYRRTGKWEAHIWCNSKQVYLGGYVDEAAAAR